MMIKLWEPITHELKAFDTLIDNFLAPVNSNTKTYGLFHIEDTDTSLNYELDVPGFNAETLEVTIENASISVSGESRGRKVHASTKVMRNDLNFDSATYEVADGILRIEIPKNKKDINKIKVKLKPK